MKKQQLLSLALGSAFAVAAISPAIAANPFEASKLDSGYQLAQADMKQKDGKCGEAKCGADKKKRPHAVATKRKMRLAAVRSNSATLRGVTPS